jgi:hypothetical protein
VATTLAAVVSHRHAHWRVDEVSAGDRAVLEAIDAPGGWWLVRPGRDSVVLEPTDAAALWGHLAELASVRSSWAPSGRGAS